MILELGSSTLEVVRVTAEYSNAVLVAVLPYISDVSQKLDLPLAHPITAEHVVHCSINPLQVKQRPDVRVEIGVQSSEGAWYFAFSRGYVETIQSSHSYYILQDPDEIPQYFGEVRMSKAEAIQLGRDTLKKLGIPLESVFAEQAPRVTEPIKIGTNTVPHYRVEWPDPRGVGQCPACVSMDINGNAKRFERIAFRPNKNLDREPPKLNVMTHPDPRFPFPPQREINPEYARQFIPILLRSIDEVGEKFSLPFPRPLSTNHVARVRLEENLGGPYCKVELTNGWRFLYEGVGITSYHAPDNLFSDDRPIRIKDFIGQWRLTETQCVEVIRRTLAKVNPPTNLVHMDFAPQVSTPAVPGIPRYMFRWDYVPEGRSFVTASISAEVDADKGELKSLYYGDLGFGKQKPAIDVPLLLPPTPETNAAPSAKSRLQPKAPHRPLTPFKLPREKKTE